MSIRNRKPMTFLKRDGQKKTPYVHPQATLLPRELFKGRPALLDAYDRMDSLQKQLVTFSANARDLTAQAADAKQTYHREVREVMATGGDASTVVNHEDRLLVEAKVQQEFADEARRAAVQHGYVLGELIAQAAPDLLGPSEKQMEKAHKAVLDAAAHLEAQSEAWAQGWHVRRILSSAWLYGGQLSPYRGEAGGMVTGEIADVVSKLTDATLDLDRLKADELEVLAFRAAEAKATAANAAMAKAAAPRTGTFMSI